MTIARSREDGRFFLSMAIVSILIIFAGFAPSFYLKSVLHAPPPLSPLTYVHGFVFTAWALLFVTQATLIDIGRPALHRQLGVLGAVLFGVVLALGLSTAITAGRLGHAPPGSPAPLVFMALPIIVIAGTATLVILALANRTQRDFHKRLMLAAFITMTPPGSGRIAIAAGQAGAATWIGLGVMDALLGVAMSYDAIVHKRVHPAYLWSAVVYLVVNLGVAWAFASPAWLSFAMWLTRAR